MTAVYIKRLYLGQQMMVRGSPLCESKSNFQAIKFIFRLFKNYKFGVDKMFIENVYIKLITL